MKAYQASFDTAQGDWTTVRLPWHEFVPVNMAKYNPEAGPLDPAKILSLGLVYSRFDLNNLANPNHTPGARQRQLWFTTGWRVITVQSPAVVYPQSVPMPCSITGVVHHHRPQGMKARVKLASLCAGEFSIEIEGGISAYTAPRPALVLVSSAGTERNAIIGDDIRARAADIPIVQLNPGGTLNWKYKGEAAVRASGLPYCVVRPTGLIQEGDDRPEDKEPYTVEFAQVCPLARSLLSGMCWVNPLYNNRI